MFREAIASRSMLSWVGEPTRFRITPATRTSRSKVAYPCTMAATDRAIAEASITRRTGASRSFATWAVEAYAGQSGHQTGRDGGLARSRVGASDDDARSLYHSMPFCPR